MSISESKRVIGLHKYLKRLINFVAPGALKDDSNSGLNSALAGVDKRLQTRLYPINARLRQLRQELVEQRNRIQAAREIRNRNTKPDSNNDRVLLQAEQEHERVLEQIAKLTAERDFAIAELTTSTDATDSADDPASGSDKFFAVLVRARTLQGQGASDGPALKSTAELELCLSQLEFWLSHRRRIHRLISHRFEPGELMQRRILAALEAVDNALIERSSIVLDRLELAGLSPADRELSDLLEQNEESFRLVIELTTELSEHAAGSEQVLGREQAALKGLRSILDRLDQEPQS